MSTTCLEPTDSDVSAADPTRAVALDVPRTERRRRPKRNNRWVPVVALVVVVVVSAAGVNWWSHHRRAVMTTSEPLVFHTVKSDDLRIVVTDRGSLESQRETEVVCEIEPMPGWLGTRIIYLVPNGSWVKKGDLLVEFESGPLEERVDNQVIKVEQARATLLQSTARYENQQAQNVTNLSRAALNRNLAEKALNMYEDGTEGTHQIALWQHDLRIQDAQSQIKRTLANRIIRAAAHNGMKMLYKQGFRTKPDLDKALYDYLQADDEFIKAKNSLSVAVADRTKLERYEHPMKKMELDGTLSTARQALTQTDKDNISQLAQAKAAVEAAQRLLEKETEKLEKYTAQLDKRKIYSPTEGMVAYADRTPWGWAIAEGTQVGERMKILGIPDLASMQVRAEIHESVLHQVHVGHRATIRVDAFPERAYQGVVQLVAGMPSPQQGSRSSDVKLYDVVVTIDEEVEGLKPGMSAVVDISVDRLRDVLAVPVQAVVQSDGINQCYVQTPGGVRRQQVDLGPTNDRFVQVREGLEEGDLVVLNPRSIVDETRLADRGEPGKPDTPRRAATHTAPNVLARNDRAPH
jgi:HlyD family secretion protein